MIFNDHLHKLAFLNHDPIEAVPELPKYRSQRPNLRSLELGRNQASIFLCVDDIGIYRTILANSLRPLEGPPLAMNCLKLFHDLNSDDFPHSFNEMLWEAEMLERMLIKVQKPALGNTQTLQLQLVSLQVVLQGWQAVALGWRHTSESVSRITPLEPLPGPWHCVPSHHTNISYHRVPYIGSTCQHLSSTSITPAVSLSFV